MSRTTLNNFFKGDPVQRKQFHAICKKLKFDWQPPAIEKPQSDNSDLDTIVQAIRERIKPIVHEKCGTMRVLDMEQPIELTGERGIYTNVNILERITGRNRLEIAEILQNCGVEEFDRAGLSQVTGKRVPGLKAVEQHHKLMVLGKPGAGKSTFLKYLAMQCIEGNFQADRIPVFITLKDFAEIKETPDLFTYISQLIKLSNSDALQKVLEQGQLLVLLDGLDEVREEDTQQVLRQILEFSEKFHLNQFVITCRIAAKEYTFERFTEVEVADFDQKQIAIFAQNWFRLSDPVKAERLIQKLRENEPIRELASSPLLLTLLCLVFGESADFPANRSELYKEGLDVLLKKWDGKRNIHRDQLYKNLSLKRKEDLLSQIALITFEQKDYFFKQKTLEAYISDFIRNIPNVDSDPEVLRMDSEAVLKSIEAQHGLFVERAKSIYSFSHLTFQEYFAAKEIVANSAYESLVKHLTEKRWREVFLLTASMMRNADDLLRLMKQNVDEMLADDENLQQSLRWVNQKSSSVEVHYKPAAVRAFYFSLARAYFYYGRTSSEGDGRSDASTIFFALDLDLATSLDLDLAHTNLDLDCYLDRNLAMHIDRSTTRNISIARELARELTGELAYFPTRNSKLKRELQEIQDQLSDSLVSREKFERWSHENGQVWSGQLRAVIIEHRNIGHDWQFSDKQKQLLQQYYDANKLLVNCLNSDCYVSRDVRQEIEETLLLPTGEIGRDRTSPT